MFLIHAYIKPRDKTMLALYFSDSWVKGNDVENIYFNK